MERSFNWPTHFNDPAPRPVPAVAPDSHRNNPALLHPRVQACGAGVKRVVALGGTCQIKIGISPDAALCRGP